MKRLIALVLCGVLAMPAAVQAHSARRAFWYSLLIPGWGQYYTGRSSSGTGFLAAEAGLWGSFFGLRHLGEIRRTHYRTYAAEHAGARPEGKSSQFFEDLGFYQSRQQHNQSARYEDGPEAQLYPDGPEFFWEWDQEGSRWHYRDLRNASKRARQQALYATGLVVANHLIAAVHASRGARAGAVEVVVETVSDRWGVAVRRRF